MALLPQDIAVLLKLALGPEGISYADLGQVLGLSPSQVHASVKRSAESRLLLGDSRQVNVEALLEFIFHGLKYVFPPKRGGIARGLPSAHSAPPLKTLIRDPGIPLVWPDPQGTVRGESIEPLYKYSTTAARNDKKLYQALALIDAIRSGRARERNLASKELRKILESSNA